MKIREYCDVSAKGRNPYPFINAIRQSDILCGEQHCKGEEFRCRILWSDAETLRRLAEEFHIEVHFQKKRSLIGMFRRYRLRFGILVGVLIGAGLIFYQSNIVETIEIQGNQAVYESVILSVLEQEGLHRGVWIPDIDLTHCERSVRAVIPEIAWCGIRIKGNHLTVQVTEITPQTPMLYERTPCNIVSLYDAQITDVKVYNGHLQRLIGDGVAAGEMLVSGVFQDKFGKTAYHHAIASITGIYTKEAELTEYFEVTENQYTGNSFRQRWLRIFGLHIPLTLGKPDFADFTETERETPLSLFSHTLPCGIVHRVTTERKTTHFTRSEEETMLALNAAIVRYEKNILSDVTILARTTDYIQTDEGITCRVWYQVEGEIGTESDIFIK